MKNSLCTLLALLFAHIVIGQLQIDSLAAESISLLNHLRKETSTLYSCFHPRTSEVSRTKRFLKKDIILSKPDSVVRIYEGQPVFNGEISLNTITWELEVPCYLGCWAMVSPLRVVVYRKGWSKLEAPYNRDIFYIFESDSGKWLNIAPVIIEPDEDLKGLLICLVVELESILRLSKCEIRK